MGLRDIGLRFGNGDLADGAFFSMIDDQEARKAFFLALFPVMAHIAKSDGRVCEDEIRMAEKIIQRMALNPRQRKYAIYLFNKGKNERFDLQKALMRFCKEVERRALLRSFLDCQLRIAYAAGIPQDERLARLEMVRTELEFTRLEFEHMARSVGEGLDQSGLRLSEAYAILQLQESASEDEIKTVYRRLMQEHHPDRLQANNASEEELRNAGEKAHQIKTAYEQVRSVRGF